MRPLLLLFVAAFPGFPLGLSPADVRALIQQSVQVTSADLKAAPGYDYSETDLESDGSRKTYAVRMLFGSPYRELIAVNGHPLPADQQAAEQQKLHEEIAKRRNEPAGERARRIAGYEKEQDRDRRFLEELLNAFDFRYAGESTVNGREVYVLDARVRPGYRPKDNPSKVLTGMQGRLWIDKPTKQWVKVHAEVVHPVSIEGFLAEVEPGTRFELEKVPVTAGIWLPSRFAMYTYAKILALFHHNNREDIRYFNYHRSAPQE